MEDWNVIITVFQGGYRRALRVMRQLDPVERSPYHNVLVMKVDDSAALLSAVEIRTRESPALYDTISRVAPAQRTFDFRTCDELLTRAKSVNSEWSPRLAGCRCYARPHLVECGTTFPLRKWNAVSIGIGGPASIAFTDPDAIVAVDTIDNRAGLALWTRD